MIAMLVLRACGERSFAGVFFGGRSMNMRRPVGVRRRRRVSLMPSHHSADFRKVCNLAGLEPEAVRRAAQVAIDRCEKQLSATERQPAQPNSQKCPAGERVLARRLVGEGNFKIASH